MSGSRTLEALQDRVPSQPVTEAYNMGFLSQFEGKMASETELSTLKKEREEARQLAARLHLDLDRIAAESEQYKQRLYGAERANAAAQQEAKASKLALLQCKQQNEVIRTELLKAQHYAAHRDAMANELQSSLAEAKTGLARAQQEMENIRRERESEPISDLDLLIHYKRLRTVFESLQATLTCALCFETLGGGDPITLACGHTFCLACVQQWAVRSSINHYNATQGQDMTAQCPECRSDASRQGRVKVFMLEEAVRVLKRLDKADMNAATMEQEEDMNLKADIELDEEAAAILRPRQRARYAGA